MKTAVMPNPSRTEILNWVNTHVEQTIGPVKRVQDLGNGAAYLYLIAQLRPGSVKTEKIIKNPVSHQDALHNLRLLSSVLEKLQLHYAIQGEKLAQMKYQENYYLSCFLFKSFTNSPEVPPQSMRKTNQNVNASNKLRKIKIIPPQKKIIPILTKDPPADLTIDDLHALHSGPEKKLKQIESVFEESESSRQKLQKIANILNLNIKRSQKKSIATMTQQMPSNNLSIEASYKRFLRPSLCERSSFLNSNKIPFSYDKIPNNQALKSSKQAVDAKVSNTPTQMLASSEFQGEMLLSQKKEEREAQKEEGQTGHNMQGGVQFCEWEEKEQGREQKLPGQV